MNLSTIIESLQEALDDNGDVEVVFIRPEEKEDGSNYIHIAYSLEEMSRDLH